MASSKLISFSRPTAALPDPLIGPVAIKKRPSRLIEQYPLYDSLVNFPFRAAHSVSVLRHIPKGARNKIRSVPKLVVALSADPIAAIGPAGAVIGIGLIFRLE